MAIAKDANSVLKMIKDKDISYVDFRFTDPRGKMQHVSFAESIIDEDAFADGMMFDGSSIAGWKEPRPAPGSSPARILLRKQRCCEVDDLWE